MVLWASLCHSTMIQLAVWSTPACQLGWTVFLWKNSCARIESAPIGDLFSVASHDILVLYMRFAFLSVQRLKGTRWFIWDSDTDTTVGERPAGSWQAGPVFSTWQQMERERGDVICCPLCLPWYALLASCHLLSWCSAWAPGSHRAAPAFVAGGFLTAAPVQTVALVALESAPAAPTRSVWLVRPHQTAPCWKNAASPEIANHTTSDYSPHPLKEALIILSRQQDLYVLITS